MSIDTPFIHGASKLKERIQLLRERTGVTLNSTLMLEALKTATLRRFDAQVSPTGIKWPARAISDKRSAGRPLLVETGSLRGAITVIRGYSAGALGSATGAGGRIGISGADAKIARYARFHQFGIGVKKRRFLGVGAEDVAMVDSMLRAIIRTSNVGV